MQFFSLIHNIPSVARRGPGLRRDGSQLVTSPGGVFCVPVDPAGVRPQVDVHVRLCWSAAGRAVDVEPHQEIQRGFAAFHVIPRHVELEERGARID